MLLKWSRRTIKLILTELIQDQNPWWQNGAIRLARGYPARRDLQPQILSQLLRLDERRALVLVGPRQVGKTVLLHQIVDDLLDKGWPSQNLTFFDFSDDRITEAITAREVAEVRPADFNPAYPAIFLLDEIRSAPNWDLWLKQAVDHRVGRIVATDSAAGLLRDGARESGQGRWDEHVIESLSFREFARLHSALGEEVEEVVRRIPNLYERYLAIGGFPEHIWNEDYPEVRRRLRRDVADRAIVHDLSSQGVDVQRVKDLFVYLVQDSGAEFNAEARGRDLGADARTIREWLRLLSDTLLILPLERYSRNAASGLRSKSKIFASDPGLVTSFASLPTQDAGVRAKVFEAAVFRHLREAARELKGSLTYFRNKDDLEIDFVLETGGELVGVEVTSNVQVRPDKVARLRKAGEKLGTRRLLLVHGGLVESGYDVRSLSLRTLLVDPIGCIQEISNV